MNENLPEFSQRQQENILSAISAGFFFILVGAIFVTTPNLFDRILAFFRNFNIVSVPNIGILLPAPASPRTHLLVYAAAQQFSFVWGLIQIVILALRFVVNSPLNKKAETVSNLVFWLGAGFLIGIFLTETTRLREWFAFWSTIIMLIGFSLIVRAIVLAAASTRRTT